MTHHQVTVRIMLLLIALVLLGGLIYYFLFVGIIEWPFGSNTLLAKPVTQASATSTLETATSSKPKVAVPVLPTLPSNQSGQGGTSTNSGSAPEPIITNGSNGMTIPLLVGETFAVNLDPKLHWTVTFTPSSSVQLVQPSSASAEQGTYKATTSGTVKLGATGAPICTPSQACPMFLATFSTTLDIQ